MHRHNHWLEDEPDEDAAQRQTMGLVGIVIVLLLLVGGLFLVQQLHRAALIEDCLLSGRQNCDGLVTAQR